MMPSARLTQARFEDLDLLCALNFAAACTKAGIRKIVYLGGLLPQEGELSLHLQSRQEVEQVLRSTGIPVVTLRAGLIIGPGGSSFQILKRLVERLPVMICPSWTQTFTQPVSLEDVVEALEKAALDDSLPPGAYDLGVPDRVHYLALMKQCAAALGVKRRFWKVPVFSARLSRRWICATTGAPFSLVGPLVESLREPMTVDESRRFPLGREPHTLTHSLRTALAEEDAQGVVAFRGARRLKSKSLVRSVQRMSLPKGRGAPWAAKEYLRWLPLHLRGLIQVRGSSSGMANFILVPFGLMLLQLQHSPEHSHQERQLFYITGGILAKGDGRDRFEIREADDSGTLLTAVHDFSPRLPWWIYRYTQALFHLHIMKRFRAHLAR